MVDIIYLIGFILSVVVWSSLGVLYISTTKLIIKFMRVLKNKYSLMKLLCGSVVRLVVSTLYMIWCSAEFILSGNDHSRLFGSYILNDRVSSIIGDKLLVVMLISLVVLLVLGLRDTRKVEVLEDEFNRSCK